MNPALECCKWADSSLIIAKDEKGRGDNENDLRYAQILSGQAFR
jgi:hypothetical protein